MVPAGNKAKCLSLVNHTTKAIHHYHHHHHHHHHHHQQIRGVREKMCGETDEVSTTTVRTWTERSPELCQDYEP